MSVEHHRRSNTLAGRCIGIGHEADRGFGAVFARQIKRMLAAAEADAEPGVASSEMDENGFCGAADHVLKGGRIHEQLPVVLMRGEIE